MDQSLWNARQLDRHSPVPLYQQLSDVLTDMIHTDTLKAGDHLPSENELINLFGVSRFVVRQTLNSLSRQGLIITERGRGSFVAACKIQKPLDVLQSYSAGMKKAGIDVEVRIITHEVISPPRDISERLKLKPGEKVFLLERVAYSNEQPLNILISHIALKACDEEKLTSFKGGSLYEHFAKVCDIHLNYSQNNIEVIFASEYESRLLNQARGAVMIQILSVSYDTTGTPLEHSRVVYPATMFGFQFESHISSGNKPVQFFNNK